MRAGAALASVALLAAGALLASCTSSLSKFETTLASNDSATAALSQWCAQRALASPAQIRATPNAGEPLAATPAIRALLGVSAQEPVAYRNVRLSCGTYVLSLARNWYVPARLTPEMNSQLSTSDTPFGTVVAPLGFHRERLAAQRGAAADCPAGTVVSHSALLRLPDGAAISLVVECYTAANLR
jgi:hypothetical protein